jgi:hypothetical protein
MVASISESEYIAIVSKKIARHDINIDAYIRVHFSAPDPNKINAYSFEYDEHILTIRLPYLRACDVAIRAFNEIYNNSVAVNYVKLLPKTHRDINSTLMRL